MKIFPRGPNQESRVVPGGKERVKIPSSRLELFFIVQCTYLSEPYIINTVIVFIMIPVIYDYTQTNQVKQQTSLIYYLIRSIWCGVLRAVGGYSQRITGGGGG